MTKRRLKFDTPENVRKSLEKVANMVYRGQMDIKTANSITTTCNVILSSIRTDEQEREIKELERRLEAIE